MHRAPEAGTPYECNDDASPLEVGVYQDGGSDSCRLTYNSEMSPAWSISLKVLMLDVLCMLNSEAGAGLLRQGLYGPQELSDLRFLWPHRQSERRAIHPM